VVGRKGVIVDCLFARLPAEIIERFLSSVCARLVKQGALCIDTLASHRTMIELLGRLDFGPRKRSPKFFAYRNSASESKRDLANGQEWHLTFGDSDFYLT